MADDLIDLRSVNWSQGMFLTPDHFVRQERYVDSLFLWLVRHATDVAGLIGGGPRVEPAHRGAAQFDPVIEIDDTADALRVAVLQCRGITPGGAVVQIEPGQAVHASFPKRELEAAVDLGIYVVVRPHAKEADASVADPVNPSLMAGRRVSCTIKMDVRADETDWALLVARVRRADRGFAFERVAGFIPPCAFMSSHTALMDAFRHINETVGTLADAYGTLHRAIADYIAVARTRGIAVEQDQEALEFAGRMVMTLEQAAFAIADPIQSPRRFFQELSHVVRSAALFLSLSAPTREYFSQLGEIGEVEFASMLSQESDALGSGRRWTAHDDLSIDVNTITLALERLARLEQALEGKYLDYRISPSLESLNFVFDRTGGEPVLYKTVSKMARPQAQGQELTFVFAPLRLESREMYRLILIGDRSGRFAVGDRLTVSVVINAGEGHRDAEHVKAIYDIDGQRNIAIDFRAPNDVMTINDVRVTLRSGQPIRGAILYVRGRLQSSSRWDVYTPDPPRPQPPSPAPPVRPSEPVRVEDEILRRRSGGRLREDLDSPSDPTPPSPRPPRRYS